MNYYVNLFSPETANAFLNSDRAVTGFRISRKSYVENQNIAPGDKFICYCTKIQRFIGVLKATGKSFIDETPIFTKEEDPFVLRFNVESIVWLPFEKSIPIHDDNIWKHLSFTKNLSKDSTNWTYMVFSSPRLWPEKDCEFLEKKLIEQGKSQILYPLSEADEKKIKPSKIRLSSQEETPITIPEGEQPEKSLSKGNVTKEQRDSIKTQAKLADIGEKLGFKIWLPKSDRSRVTEVWEPKKGSLLEELPLVFDENTLKTIKNIDVLWVKGRSIARAFEVEDTTSIYSGILRMADLLSLQPMLDIKIHIVAPASRREAVFEQITRPVFAVMEKGPLAKFCTYISYDSIGELIKEKQLKHMTDTIVEEYIEHANE